MKTYEQFVNDNDINKLKNLICKNYFNEQGKENLNPNFDKTMEIEYDKENKLYKVWVDSYNNKELFRGKVGLSESHPKGKYPENVELNNYDYVTLTKSLRNNDPNSWIAHEIGHILGYRAGKRGYTENGEIVKIYSDLDLDDYPNTIDELEPFIRQMKDLREKGLNNDDIIKRIMIDYEESEAHKNDVKELDKYRAFFKKVLDEKVV